MDDLTPSQKEALQRAKAREDEEALQRAKAREDEEAAELFYETRLQDLDEDNYFDIMQELFG